MKETTEKATVIGDSRACDIATEITSQKARSYLKWSPIRHILTYIT